MVLKLPTLLEGKLLVVWLNVTEDTSYMCSDKNKKIRTLRWILPCQTLFCLACICSTGRVLGSFLFPCHVIEKYYNPHIAVCIVNVIVCRQNILDSN